MPQPEKQILDSGAIGRAVARISYEILEQNKGCEGLCLVGILTRGAHLARRIAAKLCDIEGAQVPVGILDITPFRDDRPAPGGKDRSSPGARWCWWMTCSTPGAASGRPLTR